jgi:hypothetical protein
MFASRIATYEFKVSLKGGYQSFKYWIRLISKSRCGRYAELEKGLKDLGDSQVTYHRATKVAARDIAEIRKLSSEALAGEIDPSRYTLINLASGLGLNNEKCAQLLDDAKCTVVQLKDELAECE